MSFSLMDELEANLLNKDAKHYHFSRNGWDRKKVLRDFQLFLFHTVNRIATVEDDYCEMMELKKQAEVADVAKSQSLATVSLEIRTPMNGVLGK
ncbi:hypothetical protein K1719_031178 [Acacia pycnantha]|nr:hypothetical protein K1719_031178 [Acacia pycnantha]